MESAVSSNRIEGMTTRNFRALRKWSALEEKRYYL